MVGVVHTKHGGVTGLHTVVWELYWKINFKKRKINDFEEEKNNGTSRGCCGRRFDKGQLDYRDFGVVYQF